MPPGLEPPSYWDPVSMSEWQWYEKRTWDAYRDKMRLGDDVRSTGCLMGRVTRLVYALSRLKLSHIE